MQRKLIAILTGLTLMTAWLDPALAKNNAPTGTYTATSGSSGARGHVRGPGGGLAGRRGTTENTEGHGIQIRIDSYSTQSDWDALVAAQENGAAAVLDLLGSMNRGSVQIDGKSFPVHAITSVKTNQGWNIHLLSAETFATGAGPRGRKAKGATAGYIRLQVDNSGNGKGALYTSTQVVVDRDGDVRAQGGASTATELTQVSLGG